MDRIAITGGARLEGVIPISGAKNSAIKLMVAGLLTDEPMRLTNMPRLADTRFLGKLLQRLGVNVEESDGGADGSQTILTTPEPWFEQDTSRLEYVNRIKLWRYLTDDPSYDADYWLTRLEVGERA